MTASQWVGLAAALLGFAGTGVLHCSSYSVESIGAPGAFAEAVLPEIARIKAENAKRMRRQRVGFGVLCAPFVLQIGATLL